MYLSSSQRFFFFLSERRALKADSRHWFTLPFRAPPGDCVVATKLLDTVKNLFLYVRLVVSSSVTQRSFFSLSNHKRKTDNIRPKSQDIQQRSDDWCAHTRRTIGNFLSFPTLFYTWKTNFGWSSISSFYFDDFKVHLLFQMELNEISHDFFLIQILSTFVKFNLSLFI